MSRISVAFIVADCAPEEKPAPPASAGGKSGGPRLALSFREVDPWERLRQGAEGEP